jgi:hypothetical protein
MSNGTSPALNSERDFASIPIAKGGLARAALARVQSAGLPVAPILKRVGVTPELVAEPERGLSVRSQIALLDEVAIALKDDCSRWLAISIRARSGCFITSWRHRRP